MADPNTRAGKRTPVTLKIKFKSETLEQFIERYAVDVSQGGIFIRTKEPLAVGTQMKFEFQLRDASPLIGGEGTVVWTRENDPSRPAIAPGMGVRFDRLAEGSQSVLERILAEKAKQAPNRSGAEPTKPPLFTDQPTRVAPLPMQEQLLGSLGLERPRKKQEDSYNDQHTPLPKPLPFHSDADEFPEEAFEEATKVRPLDELVAQTAEGGGAEGEGDPLAAAAAAAAARTAAASKPPPIRPAAFNELESAPGLPSPPEAGLPPKPGRLLDTSPSPRIESPPPTPPPSDLGPKTRLGLGLEAPRMQAPSAVPGAGATIPGPGVGGSGPSSIPPAPASAAAKEPPPRSIGAEPTAPVRMTAPRKSPIAAIAILILVVLAAGAAGVWFFVLRPKAAENATTTPQGSGSDKLAPVGSGTGSGSDKLAPVGSGAGSGSDKLAAGSGSDKVETPKGPAVDTLIEAVPPKATIEIVGTEQRGDAPFTAKLEKDKPYKARVMAVGYATLEMDIVGGAKQTAMLVAKPRVLSVKTDPTGAIVSVDGVVLPKTTPFEIELTKAQLAKKSLKIRIAKASFKPVDKVLPIDSFTEDADKMVAKLDEKLAAAPIQLKPPPGTGSGGTGSGGTGSGGGTPPDGAGSGSAAAPPPPPPPPPTEPEPEVSKP